MTLPLPFKVDTGQPQADPEAVQGNFDAVAARFPLSRKDIAVELPHIVGDPNEPAFQNSWVNFDTSADAITRFWKDPLGMVRIEGLVKSGTIGAFAVFTLPEGYRPARLQIFGTDSNSAHGRVDVFPTGEVMARIGSNVYVTLSGISFKQEQ